MNVAAPKMIEPAAFTVHVKDGNKPEGLEATVQGPEPAKAPNATVVEICIVVPAVPEAGFKAIPAAANTRGRSPIDGRFIDGIVIFGIDIWVNGRILISGIVIWGIVMCGAGTTNADMNRSTRYTKLTRRVTKLLVPRES